MFYSETIAVCLKFWQIRIKWFVVSWLSHYGCSWPCNHRLIMTVQTFTELISILCSSNWPPMPLSPSSFPWQPVVMYYFLMMDAIQISTEALRAALIPAVGDRALAAAPILLLALPLWMWAHSGDWSQNNQVTIMNDLQSHRIIYLETPSPSNSDRMLSNSPSTSSSST